MILAGDVGATKILLEVGEARSDRWQPAFQRRYQLAEFANMSDVLAKFIGELKSSHPSDGKITAAAMGAAGPAVDNKVKMTHRSWILDGAHIAHDLGLARATVVNDLDAAANGIPWLPASDFSTIQEGPAIEHAPRVVLGVGTGLGIAYIVEGKVIPGEGGHAGFSPASAPTHDLWAKLAMKHGRLEAEEVASGTGISNIYRALTGKDADPATITSGAQKGDPICRNVLELFSECLGNVAGDHALSVMARGGVFLAGGVAAKNQSFFTDGRFMQSFLRKGRFVELMREMPVDLIVNEHVGLIGAAAVARAVGGR